MTTVYDPADWPHFYDDPRRNTLLSWLEANGIDPHIIPLDHPITVEEATIRYTAMVTDEHGNTMTHHDDVLREERAAWLQAPVPPSLQPGT